MASRVQNCGCERAGVYTGVAHEARMEILVKSVPSLLEACTMAKVALRRSFALLFVIVAAASWAVAQTPVITQVSKISTQQYQTIVITGSGFGTHKPYTGDSAYISLEDQTKSPGWQAGYSPFNDTVTLIVHQWADTRIVLGGFSGA